MGWGTVTLCSSSRYALSFQSQPWKTASCSGMLIWHWTEGGRGGGAAFHKEGLDLCLFRWMMECGLSNVTVRRAHLGEGDLSWHHDKTSHVLRILAQGVRTAANQRDSVPQASRRRDRSLYETSRFLFPRCLSLTATSPFLRAVGRQPTEEDGERVWMWTEKGCMIMQSVCGLLMCWAVALHGLSLD